ncbi:MAG: aspartate carbamoyltransferase regulatory subunit [Oscillospiraceae bacterium]|nr:aspartate carbamoyltransferase regulatory subunit [Oscillospiraceae bacterium]MCD8321537.1 aspartate carbamoyltransferase regulatory subunit [Oscillospiraceae bacterium]
MNVDAIKNGIVIDHIKAGQGMEIYRFLGLESLDCPVALMKNVVSHQMGKKDIIKIDGELGLDLNVLGYIDPDITIDIIQNERCLRKYHPTLPEQIRDIVRCKNPRCITTTEQELPQIFRLADREKKIYRCIYCDAKAKA